MKKISKKKHFSAKMKKHFNAEIKAIRKIKSSKAQGLFPQDNIEKAYKVLKNYYKKKYNKDNYKPEIIHVIGSNGKGSTCFLLEREIYAKKKSVAVFSSPHLLEITERFRINTKDLSYGDLYKSYRILERIIDKKIFLKLSFFELCFLLAMENFFRRKVQYIILEAGLGGRLDATRQAGGKIVLITSISKEHTKFLGNCKKEILREKMMIAREGETNIFFYRVDVISDLMNIEKIVFEDEKEYFSKSKLFLLKDKLQFTDTKDKILPSIKENYFLAKIAAEMLLNQKENFPSVNILNKKFGTQKKHRFSVLAFESVFPDFKGRVTYMALPGKVVPSSMELPAGRNELYSFSNRFPYLAFDGAHNPAAVKKLLKDMQSFVRKRKNTKEIWIYYYCGLQQDKNIKKIKKYFKKFKKKTPKNIHLIPHIKEIKQKTISGEYHFIKEHWNAALSTKNILEKKTEFYFVICGSFLLYSAFSDLKKDTEKKLKIEAEKGILWSI